MVSEDRRCFSPKLSTLLELGPIEVVVESRRTKGPEGKSRAVSLMAVVESNQRGGGMIASPVDMFDSSRDGGTCMGGDGTCCGMSAGVSGSCDANGVSVLDRPLVV